VEDVYESRKADVWDYGTLGISYLFRENKVKVGTEKVLNFEKYLSSLKQQMVSFLQKTKTEIISQTKIILKEYLKNVSSEVDKAISDRQEELDKEKQSSFNNDKIIESLDALKKKQNQYPSEIKKIAEIIEEVSL